MSPFHGCCRSRFTHRRICNGSPYRDAPPAPVVVQHVDEKQIHALDRTQPTVPSRTLMVAVPCRFDRSQHAARSPSGVHPFPQRRQEVPVGTTVHAILDKYAAYMRPAAPQWVERPSALHRPPHADVGFLAQRRRGLFQYPHKVPTEARRLPIRRRPPGRDQSLSQRSQRQFQTIRVGRPSPIPTSRRRQTRAAPESARLGQSGHSNSSCCLRRIYGE